MPVATHEDVERLARRPLTASERTFAVKAIAAVTATLERKLNRILDPREITETVRVGPTGVLNLTRGPVRQVTAATVGDLAYSDSYLRWWDTVLWPVGADVEVTYLAGTDPDAGIRDTIAGAVARTIHTPANAALGVIGSYSVEGTSITYRTSEQAEGGLFVGELKGIGRLRRPVLL